MLQSLVFGKVNITLHVIALSCLQNFFFPTAHWPFNNNIKKLSFQLHEFYTLNEELGK
jgi:hypothetical protein